MLQIRLHNDLARKCININAPLTENMDAMMSVEIVPSGLVFKLCFCPGMRERSKTSVASLPICASLTGLRELFGWSGFSGGTDMF